MEEAMRCGDLHEPYGTRIVTDVERLSEDLDISHV